MADQIRVESSELASCAASYMSALGTLQECVQQYSTALDALRNDFTGKAFIIMSGKVANMVSKIVESFDRVQDAVQELGYTQEVFEENEDAQKARFSALDVGSKSPFVG